MGNKKHTTRILANELYDILRVNGYDKLTLRPYNHYNPDNTLWWIIPSKEWPAYKFWKIAIYKPEGHDYHRIGFHIEKGISTTAGKMLSTISAEKLCIRSDWVWNIFMEEINNGNFEGKLRFISEKFNLPLRISIQASNVTSEYDPSSKPVEGYENDHMIIYKFQGNELIVDDEYIKGEMRKYSKIDKINDLSELLNEKSMDWFWIDVIITFDFHNDGNEKLSETTLALIDNFKNYL